MSEDRMAQLDAEIKAELAKLNEKSSKPVDDVNEDSVEIDHAVKVFEESKKEDPYLEEAVKMGFNPDYQGPGKKTAEQFVKDGSYFRKIEAQKKELEEVKKTVRELAEHNAKIEKATREKVIKELEEKKMNAVAHADLAAYEEADKEQQAIKKEVDQIQTPSAPAQAEQPADLRDFLDRNKDWCNLTTPENQLMAKSADGLCEVVAEEARLKGETITLKQQLERVEEKIKKLFPERFRNTEQDKPPMMETSTTSSGGEKTKSLAGRLTDRQRKLYNDAKKYGSQLSAEEYAKQLQLTGELRDE